MTFPCEVVDVVFLGVPLPVGWIHNVISPAIRLCVGHCILKLTKFNLNSAVGVMRSTCPSHKWRLIVALSLEVHLPIFADCFVEWVVMDVLLLRHIDPTHSIPVLLGVPRSIPVVSSRRALDIKFRPFVNSNLFWVHVSENNV